MENNFFTDSNLTINENKSDLKEEDILEQIPLKFEGENDFASFYSVYNGLVFPWGAFFYRDHFYQVSENEYNLLDIGSFFGISDSSNSILKMWQSLKEDSRTEQLNSEYLPFGNDSSGNLYCIQSESGTIFYLPHENPMYLTAIAPSFLKFCGKIQSEMR